MDQRLTPHLEHEEHVCCICHKTFTKSELWSWPSFEAKEHRCQECFKKLQIEETDLRCFRCNRTVEQAGSLSAPADTKQYRCWECYKLIRRELLTIEQYRASANDASVSHNVPLRTSLVIKNN